MTPACIPLRHVLRRFLSDQRANVAMMFAFALVPMFTAVGAAVDYSRAAGARDKLTTIADGAALEAISKAALATRRKLPDYGKASTEALFNERAGSIPGVTVTNLNVSIQQTEASRDVTIEYTANVRNHFGTFLNGETTAVSGRSVASASMTFIDFYLLLDNSPSMGLGATLNDIAKMKEATKNHPNAGWRSCEFACHQVANASSPGPDHYSIARAANVTLRLDVVKQATQRLIQRTIDMEVESDQFRVAIFTFNDWPAAVYPTSSVQPTGDLQAAMTAAGNIDLVPVGNPLGNDRWTNFTRIRDYVKYIPSGGTGQSSVSRKSILFLVTDGVGDEPGAPRVKVIPEALCNDIKAKNILIAALYTTYHPIPDNDAYVSLVKPIAHQIAPAMQACASPGLFFEVSPTEGITEAMEKLLDKAVRQAHLTR